MLEKNIPIAMIVELTGLAEDAIMQLNIDQLKQKEASAQR